MEKEISCLELSLYALCSPMHPDILPQALASGDKAS